MATIHNQYLEAEVLNADPIKLVRLLYRGAIDAVVLARRHLASGAIRERSKSIIKAWEILLELTQSLDHGRGGELSQNLASLYTYMQTRLMEANSLQSERPLKEVEGLLTTLLEGWPQGHALPIPAVDEERVSLSYTG
jgi:flagellar secretion chaperone FliS